MRIIPRLPFPAHCGAGSAGPGPTGLGAPGLLAQADRTGSPRAATPRGLTLMRSRSSQEQASRTLRLPTLPLTGVGARHSDPSRLSADPFPGGYPTRHTGLREGLLRLARSFFRVRAFPVNIPESSQGPPGAPRFLLLGQLLPRNGFLISGEAAPLGCRSLKGFHGSRGVAFGHWVVWAGPGHWPRVLPVLPSPTPAARGSGGFGVGNATPSLGPQWGARLESGVIRVALGSAHPSPPGPLLFRARPATGLW